MNLQSSHLRVSTFSSVVAPMPGVAAAFDQVVLRPLKTRAEIESVLHLREEIDLSAHAAAGLHFTALEKKETSAGWWWRSTCMENA